MSDELEATLVSSVSAYLEPYLCKFHEYRISRNGEGFEVKGQVTESDIAKTLVLKVCISEDYQQVSIPNIFMPEFMRQQGIGKGMISLIHQVSKTHGYRTYVNDLTNSFFERLKKRGALVIEESETVEITDETNLA